MAKSKAKKQREHLVRQGKIDPNNRRLGWGQLDGITKRDKDMRQNIEREIKKEDMKIKQSYKRHDRKSDDYAS